MAEKVKSTGAPTLVSYITPKVDAKPTLAELKAKIAAALTSGDDTAFMAAVGQLAKAKSEVAKAQAAQAQAEATQLAGAREKLAVDIFKDVKAGKAIENIAYRLKAVKATGFTFSLDMPDANGVMTVQKSVSLSVPSVKKPRGSGAGTIGKTKDEYGMSLGEVAERFGTAEEKAKVAAASGSQQWQAKVAIKKRAIAEGLLKPLK